MGVLVSDSDRFCCFDICDRVFWLAVTFLDRRFYGTGGIFHLLCRLSVRLSVCALHIPLHIPAKRCKVGVGGGPGP